MEASAIEDYIGYALVNTNCFSFTRLLVKDNVLIYSQDYKEMISRDDSVVKLRPKKFNILFVTITSFLRILRIDSQGESNLLLCWETTSTTVWIQ